MCCGNGAATCPSPADECKQVRVQSLNFKQDAHSAVVTAVPSTLYSAIRLAAATLNWSSLIAVLATWLCIAEKLLYMVGLSYQDAAAAVVAANSMNGRKLQRMHA
jgi:hypothetical protein